jgi:DNA-binding IclR family transcriptional regulator
MPLSGSRQWKTAPEPTGAGRVAEQKVVAVERALSILEAFADGTSALSLGALAERTGLYRSTILRLAASLERFGYLRRDESGEFRLGPSLWRLGVLYQNAFSLADYVRPALKQLAEDADETGVFYVREGQRRICLYRHHGARLVRHHVEEGAELPLDRGAGGHVLMAYTGGVGARYDDIRRKGFCVSLGERDPEIAGIAAPVFGQDRRFLGALGITGPRSRFGKTEINRLTKLVADRAGALSRMIGGAGEGASARLARDRK